MKPDRREPRAELRRRVAPPEIGDHARLRYPMHRPRHPFVASLLLAAVGAASLSAASSEAAAHPAVDEVSAPTHGHHAYDTGGIDVSKIETEESKKAARLVSLRVALIHVPCGRALEPGHFTPAVHAWRSIDLVAAHGARGPPLA